MLSIDCGGQMKILLTFTEVKGAGGVKHHLDFPQARLGDLKFDSITLHPLL
jgi:hypothetical protein